MSLSAARAWLARPAPPAAWWAAALFVSGAFALAWWAFSFPLTFCDSPSWAPSYLGRLLGLPAPPLVAARGALVPAWFALSGALSIAADAPNGIGLVQGGLMLAAVLAVLLHVKRGMTRAELLVLPAFALTGLRHALYSQTILSESVVIPLVVATVLSILREGPVSPQRAALSGALAALAAAARIENVLLLGAVAARIALGRASPRERASVLAVALLAALVVLGPLARLAPRERGASVAKTMVVAEWARFTAPPGNALASALRSPLVDRLAAATAGAPVRHIYDALAPVRSMLAASGAPSWPEILRLLAYQSANRPLDVGEARLAALADLYASGYAAFWPGYRAWSPYYSPYAQLFARSPAGDFQPLEGPCSDFTRAQAAYYGRPPLRSPGAFRALEALHAGAEGYARWVLRALAWAALPAFLALLARGAGGRAPVWLGALLLANLALHAALVCADERYQLPYDALGVAWLMLILRRLVAAPPRPRPSPAPPG